MPPPVVGLTSPAASPSTRRRSPYVRSIGPRGRTFWRGWQRPAVNPHRAPQEIHHAAEWRCASASHITPIRTKRPSARSTGTAQAKPPGAASAPKCTSTAPAWRSPATRPGPTAGAGGAFPARACAAARSSHRRRARTCGRESTRRRTRPDAVLVYVDRGDTSAMQNRTRRRGGGSQLLVEPHAIDDDGFDGRGLVLDRDAGRRVEAHTGQLVEDAARAEAKRVERVPGQHARAVDGFADDRVFFDQPDAVAAFCEAKSGVEACRTATHDDDVARAAHTARITGRNRRQCRRL